MATSAAGLAPRTVGPVRAVAEVDLAAIERNCARLHALLGGSMLCAVVKADGYGHGAVAAAYAALAGGARWLAVATAPEALLLREAGVREPRILVMGALTNSELSVAVGAGADVVVWNERQVQALAEIGPVGAGAVQARVHVKLDTGMGRLGTRDKDEATGVADAARDAEGVELAGVMTHFATADDRDDDGFFDAQLEAFEAFVGTIRSRHPQVLVHAANSAAVLREPRAHFDMARCGIAVYGMDPFGADPDAHGLTPALGWHSYVAAVKLCRKGQSAGYGRRFVAERDTWLGVLPLGYGDGFRRALSNNADVLIDGRRCAVLGTVSMDNVTVDLGADPASQRLLGARATVIGDQGSERITAEELARRVQTINYEITCGITARVPRVHTHARTGPAAREAHEREQPR
jgi:alanine racemase